MTLIADSASVADDPQAATHWPVTVFPPHTDDLLRDYFAHLVNMSRDDLIAVLPGLSEPGLYTLAAALARGSHRAADAAANGPATAGLAEALVAELRWRNCRAMGTDPSGPVRRGRLLQMVGAFTGLRRVGASSLQRGKLAGRCPFCAAESLQVFLPSVRWRCFSCQRDGGLLEFAESLLEQFPGFPPSRE